MIVVDDYIDGVEIGGVGAMAGEDGGGEGALQSSEAEDRIAVMTEDELGEAVAETADTVVKEDGKGHGVIRLAMVSSPDAGVRFEVEHDFG